MLTYDETVCDLLRSAGPMCAVILRPYQPLDRRVLKPMWRRPDEERNLGAHHERILADPEDPADPLETMWFDCAEET